MGVKVREVKKPEKVVLKVGLFNPESGPKNQIYTKNFPEENTSIRGIISLEEDILLEALLVDSTIVAPIEVLLEALTKYSSL